MTARLLMFLFAAGLAFGVVYVLALVLRSAAAIGGATTTLFVGVLIGAYIAWAVTMWWYTDHDDGGGEPWEVPDFVPDDLVGTTGRPQ